MGKYIKPISRLLALVLYLGILGACSSGEGEPNAIQLHDQDNQSITLSGDKPVILFFFTTYT